jgi:hypothetical protein
MTRKQGSTSQRISPGGRYPLRERPGTRSPAPLGEMAAFCCMQRSAYPWGHRLPLRRRLAQGDTAGALQASWSAVKVVSAGDPERAGPAKCVRASRDSIRARAQPALSTPPHDVCLVDAVEAVIVPRSARRGPRVLRLHVGLFRHSSAATVVVVARLADSSPAVYL